jgi:hypothetical protein
MIKMDSAFKHISKIQYQEIRAINKVAVIGAEGMQAPSSALKALDFTIDLEKLLKKEEQ